MGYHIKEIEKGNIGELSKVYEEVEEVKDASTQDNELMVLVELSDVVGAIECYLDKHHKSITLQHLITMSDATKRAFKSGSRK